jgi:CubicO group peptidase (beta-lactamase class C family)
MIQTQVHGTVDAAFEPVRDVFAANFDRLGEVGAAFCVHLNGRRIIDLWGGVTTPGGTDPYTADTLQMVMSTTKGVVAIAAHILAEEGRLDFGAPVVQYWPEFAAQGKAGIPVRWLFSHRAGLAAIDKPLTIEDVYAWDPVVAALAAQEPNWEPGTAHGYHAATYGWLAGEVVKRVAGMSVGEFVAERLARPLDLDLWIGLPDALNARVAAQIPAPPPAAGTPLDPFTARLADPTTLMHRAFTNPSGMFAVANSPAFRAAEVPAINGITTARSLSRLYAACIGEIDGVWLLKPESVERAMRTEAHGEDLVVGYETRYGTGFQLSFPSRPMAGDGSFGHYGMGGSMAFAHPARGLSFGYVMNQSLSPSGPDPRTTPLIQAVLRCARGN